MSSLPPRQPASSPHNLGTAAHLQQATAQVNRFAKRDPSLYPLAAIVVGALGVAGYFLMGKATQVDPAKALVGRGIVNVWDDEAKHDVHSSSLAAFKYRYKTREGHYVDAAPAINEDVRTLKSAFKSSKATSS